MLLFSSLSSAGAYSDSQACFLHASILRMSLSPSKCVFWDGPCSQSLLEKVVWVCVTPEETCTTSPSPSRPNGYDACFFFHKMGALFPCKISEADGLLSSPRCKSPPARGAWWDILPRSPVWVFLILFLPSCSLLCVRGLSVARERQRAELYVARQHWGKDALGSGGSSEHMVTVPTQLEEQNNLTESTRWDARFA